MSYPFFRRPCASSDRMVRESAMLSFLPRSPIPITKLGLSSALGVESYAIRIPDEPHLAISRQLSRMGLESAWAETIPSAKNLLYYWSVLWQSTINYPLRLNLFFQCFEFMTELRYRFGRAKECTRLGPGSF